MLLFAVCAHPNHPAQALLGFSHRRTLNSPHVYVLAAEGRTCIGKGRAPGNAQGVPGARGGASGRQGAAGSTREQQGCFF